jgi:hypothetical protein
MATPRTTWKKICVSFAPIVIVKLIPIKRRIKATGDIVEGRDMPRGRVTDK